MPGGGKGFIEMVLKEENFVVIKGKKKHWGGRQKNHPFIQGKKVLAQIIELSKRPKTDRPQET